MRARAVPFVDGCDSVFIREEWRGHARIYRHSIVFQRDTMIPLNACREVQQVHREQMTDIANPPCGRLPAR